MTIHEQMTDAILTGSKLLAHALMLGIREGHWGPGDSAEGIDFDKLNLDEVKRLSDENVLGIQLSVLYTVPLSKKEFAMFFAESPKQVSELFEKQFNRECPKVHWMEDAMDRTMYFPDKKKHLTWREYQSYHPQLPAYVGLFQK